MKKIKKAYLLLNPIEIKVGSLPIKIIDEAGIVSLCGIFKTKKQALKFGKDIQEINVLIN